MQKVNTYERKPGLVVDGSHKIEGGVEAVDLAKGVATGSAFAAAAIITDVEPRVSLDTIAMDRFMSEELEVIMHDPAHETEPRYVELNVNGDYRLAVRDSQRPVNLKRCHVAILAQAKTASLRQTKTVDSEGFQAYRDQAVLRQSYPFSVQHDPSGQRGRDWLRPLITSANA